MQAAGIQPVVIRLVHNWVVFLLKQQLLHCSLISKSVFWISMKTLWQDNHPYDWEALQKKRIYSVFTSFFWVDGSSKPISLTTDSPKSTLQWMWVGNHWKMGILSMLRAKNILIIRIFNVLSPITASTPLLLHCLPIPHPQPAMTTVSKGFSFHHLPVLVICNENKDNNP